MIACFLSNQFYRKQAIVKSIQSSKIGNATQNSLLPSTSHQIPSDTADQELPPPPLLSVPINRCRAAAVGSCAWTMTARMTARTMTAADDDSADNDGQ